MRLRPCTLAASLVATTSTVSAQPSDLSSETTIERQMTLPGGHVFVQAFAEISLASDRAFEPLSIAPDLWYGVSDKLTLGLLHSGRASTGRYGGAGNGLCLSGDDGQCPDVYRNLGLDARYHFHRRGGVTLSAEGGLFAGPFDPFTAALKLGLVGRWQSGVIALDFSPNLFAGLSEREPEMGEAVAIGTSNQETLHLPITALYGLRENLGLALQVGATVPIQDAGDRYQVGASVGGQYMVTRSVMLDLAFSLPMLAKGSAYDMIDALDARTLTLGVGYAR